MSIRPILETSDQWFDFLHALISGEHARLVEILGSPAEVVRVILRDSRDRVAPLPAFENALEKFIAMWQPQSAEEPTHLINILDLVAAFTPLSALPKLIAQFELVGSWPILERPLLPSSYVNSDRKSSLATQELIEHHALLSLERYYLIRPTLDTSLFVSYKTLLFSKLYGHHWAYCLRRLVELSLLTPDDPLFIQQLMRSPDRVFEELLPVVIYTRRAVRLSLISMLFAQVLLNGLEDHFARALDRFNSKLLNDEQFPVLVTPFEEITVLLDKRSRGFSLYAASRVPSEQNLERILERLGAK